MAEQDDENPWVGTQPGADEKLSMINEKEAIEYMNEGLKLAASRARELGIILDNPIWSDIGLLCDQMRHKCEILANQRAMSRTDVLHALNVRENQTAQKLDATRKPGLIIN